MTPQEQNITHPAPLNRPSKVCSRCLYLKPLSEFKKRVKNIDGLNGVCRPCENERVRSKNFPRASDETIKKCIKCLVDKLAVEFNAHHSRLDGLSDWCKDCVLVYGLERLKNPRARAQENITAKIRNDNKSEKLNKSIEWTGNQWIFSTLWRCKRRAKRKRVSFDIEPCDLQNSKGFLPEYCSVFTHMKLDYDSGPDRRFWASVDRIIPELGYTKGNVRVISMAANAAKMDGIGDVCLPMHFK